MDTQVARRNETQVGRPLKELAPLIKAELRLAAKEGREAVERAAPHWRRLGRLGNEAKIACKAESRLFGDWLQEQRFSVSRLQFNQWMAADQAATKSLQNTGYQDLEGASLEDHLRWLDEQDGRSRARGPVTSKTIWHDPIETIIHRIRYWVQSVISRASPG